MADSKISALTASTTAPADTDVFVTIENMGTTPVEKRKAWSVIRAKLDTLYAAISGILVGAISFTASDKLLGRQTAGAGVGEEIACTAAGRALIDDADAATQRATLGLAIGTNVQAWDADLDTWAGKTPPSGTVVGTSDTQTLTAKRITPREGTVASSATPTPASDAVDVYTVTALAEAATFGAPTGTPTQGQKLIVRIKDNATARALSWNAIYRAVGVALPTTTVISKTLYVGFIYNSTDTKWDCVATAQEA